MAVLDRRLPLVRRTYCIRFAKRSYHCGILGNPNRHPCGCFDDRFAQIEVPVVRDLGIHGRWNVLRHRCRVARHIGCIRVGKRSCCFGIWGSPNRHRWNGRFGLGDHRGHFARSVRRGRCVQIGRHDHFVLCLVDRCPVRQIFALHEPFLLGC